MGKRKLILTLGVIAVGIQSAMAMKDDFHATQNLVGSPSEAAAQQADQSALLRQKAIEPEKGVPQAADVAPSAGHEQLAALTEEFEAAKKEGNQEEMDRLQGEIDKKMAEFHPHNKPQKKAFYKRTPFWRTVAGVAGVAGLPSTYFLAEAFKTAEVGNGNTANTTHLGFENASDLNGNDAAHDLHDIMFSDNLNNLRTIETDASDFTAEGAFNEAALTGNVCMYLAMGMVFALITICFLVASGWNSKWTKVLGIAAASCVGLGGSLAMGGYAMWFDSYNPASTDVSAFGDQWLIILGIAVAAAGMLAFLIYLTGQFFRALCSKEAFPRAQV